MRLLKRRHGRGGWSLIELTIILVCLSILCAILAPVIGRYVRRARMIRCREDVQCLGIAIWGFLNDSGSGCFRRDGSAPPSPENAVALAVSDGDIPELGPAPADARWVAPVDFAGVDYLEYHLSMNRPGNNPAHHYPTPDDLTGGSGAPIFARPGSRANGEFSWRGPYMTAPIDPDPWGNRYAVNVLNLCASGGDGTGVDGDCIVLSAGPDEAVDTDFEGTPTETSDDVTYVLSGNSRP